MLHIVVVREKILYSDMSHTSGKNGIFCSINRKVKQTFTFSLRENCVWESLRMDKIVLNIT